MTTGERIKFARKEAGLTQRELGERLGITYQTVAQWENNLRNPKFDTLRRIAEALDIAIDYLWGFTDSPDTRIATQGDIDKILDGEVVFTSENLSKDEAEMIEKFKRLPPEERKRISDIVNYEFGKVLDSFE